MYPYISLWGYVSPFDNYSLFKALGFLFGVLLGLYNAPKAGFSRARTLEVSVWLTIFGLLGSRLLYIILFLHRYSDLKDIFPFHSGQVFFGGFLGGTITVVLYLRYHRLSVRDFADLTAPSLGLAHCLGRLGCFCAGCCYGKPTTVPWGVLFPFHTQPRHPTQLYEAFFLLFLSFWTLRMLHTRSGSQQSDGSSAVPAGSWLVRGRIGGLYLIAYGCFRFLLEYLRDDNRGGFFTPLALSPSQLISLAIIVVALFWLRYCAVRARDEAVSANLLQSSDDQANP